MTKKQKRKVQILIARIILVLILVLVVFLIVKIVKGAREMVGESTEVANYDSRVNIWANMIPGNSKKSKVDYMDIDYSQDNVLVSTIDFTKAIANKEYADEETTIDTFTYLTEIKTGFEKDTFEDEPYLIPYVVEGSEMAVIIVPGGGFGYKSIDGGTSEGKDIADSINKKGISAFVLHYRSNPYEYPIPYLDLQRSIKFLKAHSEEYGINKDKISLIGFSAGANLVAYHINKVQNKEIYPYGYIKDSVDAEDGSVSTVAMIYPCLTFNANVPMLFGVFNANDIRNDSKRQEILDTMDNVKNFDSANVKQFIAYGKRDLLVGTTEVLNYIDKAKENNTDMTVVAVSKGEHAFEQKHYMNKLLNWLTK